MPTVAALGAAALVVTAGVILSGSPAPSVGSGHGELLDYTSTPETAWTLDDSSLPGLTGDGDITVADTRGDDWLVSYTTGIRTSYVLVDAATGELAWDEPVNTGFGACAFDDDDAVGCAIRPRAGGDDNGFYVIGRDGRAEKTADGSDTARLIGLGDDFVHVSDSGYRVTRQTVYGAVKWSRTFAAAATPRLSDGLLVVSTVDGGRFVLDPDTGDDRLACESCEVTTYPTGVAVEHRRPSDLGVAFHPVVDRAVAPRPAATADGLVLSAGPSTLPVVTASDQTLEASGHYQVIDPATGHALWQVADPELSKVHAFGCGPVVTFARKDRSRVFFTLADGSRLGDMASPRLGQPDTNLDYLHCVGASDEVAVFGDTAALTAYRTDTGEQAWTLPINGTASAVDGRIVLLQGSQLSVLKPN